MRRVDLRAIVRKATMVEAVLWPSRTVHRDYQQRIIESRRVSRVQKCHRNKIKRGFVTRQLPKSRHQISSCL
ncbi:MAG: hypothetical protein F6K49_49550 [Moorea sp. SIO3I6]|nr:hypothetical protein [Moorena sp. SIO3I6]